ncbi:ACT domain-containing protein ACR3 [Oryza brachyantha]|uniref:ACT domain-containing protein ACR3 n=1 Tax=Oryza brachyantha TaxID=4533 RepID=UPI001AD9843F|nr:ACT domain-containing protein ACR3 [Oryza brachyantha]XP_040376634.1 ACT domain-containing protein ACR3 [Oryza brachyantha]XP_040376635.1 ACT domain-containing protein ACR3 [Oryza brachyantha]XP_040376636.1 ACT domain-containing protein ACR3 [Oryza brachyantha]XP_040376637.1 ACT domain-containing protein ACR3 [Oryza brachyantha]XP_040376638.1 ACT domain-containing protein ACR3 [Oryza brachyantha]XP_040376640.1 ACT domain-containing protein ACR3 [Oryza brachyantha]XP_040376641.1 ACT domain
MLPYFDPEYENFSQRINPPRVCIDNSTCSDCTLVKVDSMNKNGILLEVVQVLSDLDLAISKAYITSDGGWFMDVFHVVDKQGQKVTDEKTIKHIEKALGPDSNLLGGAKGGSSPVRSVGMHSIGGDHTAIELKGPDRTGLLSEVFAVLAELGCNVLAAEVWTHRARVACVVYVNDVASGQAIGDACQLSRIEHRLRQVLRGHTAGGGDDRPVAHTNFFSAGSNTHVDRRLHQLMHADVDADDGAVGPGGAWNAAAAHAADEERPAVTVEHCEEKDYSVVNVKCRDRSKLLFDIVCTLTDMEYVVSHASVSSDGIYGLQELYIRRKDGRTLQKDEAERVIKCLEAAISRRVSEGFTLELCGRDRVGLLSDVTRVLREHGLTVTRADVTTVGEQAINVFYVRDASGQPVDMKTIEGLRVQIGQTVMLNVKKVPSSSAAKSPGQRPASGGAMSRTSFFSFGNLFAKLRA